MYKFKRILLKISGETLMGDQNFGHDVGVLRMIANDVKAVYDSNIEVCLVIGGGNICRGSKFVQFGIDRATADYMGMLATVINALAMQSIIEELGIQTRVMSAVPMTTVCEPYIKRKARRHMEKGRIVIFAAGTGNPFFTTDTAAVLRAVEMNCGLLLKGTQVNGVYSSDPHKNKDAKKFDSITYDKILQDNLNVMDMAAIALARENHLPIRVFSIKNKGNLVNALSENNSFTEIT